MRLTSGDISKTKLHAIGKIRPCCRVIVRQQTAGTNITIGERGEAFVQHRRIRLHGLGSRQHRRQLCSYNMIHCQA